MEEGEEGMSRAVAYNRIEKHRLWGHQGMTAALCHLLALELWGVT